MEQELLHELAEWLESRNLSVDVVGGIPLVRTTSEVSKMNPTYSLVARTKGKAVEVIKISVNSWKED